MKKIIFFVLVVLVGFGAYWLYAQKVKPLESNKPSMTSSTASNIQLKIFDTHNREGDTTLGYSIDVNYPQLSGLPGETQNIANRLIEDFITTTTAQFKKNVADFKTDIADQQSSLQIDYTLTALNTKILSLEFNVYEYMAGAAHPNTFVHAFNYNIKDLKAVVTLQDVFVPGANYLPLVSNFARTDLKAQLKNDLAVIENDIDKGTEAKEENFREFVLTTHGLKLIFNPYQVGPYALGKQQVFIPYQELKDVLPANSFLLDFK